MLVFPEDSVSQTRREICDIIRKKHAPVVIVEPVKEVKPIKEKIDASDISIRTFKQSRKEPKINKLVGDDGSLFLF